MADIDKILDLLQKAVDFRRAEKYNEAQQCLEQLLALQSDYPQALNEMGLVLTFLGEYEQAESYFKKRLAKELENPQSLVGLGYLFRKQGHFTQAVTYFEKVLEKDAKNTYVLNELGLTYEEQGDKEKAYTCFKKVSEFAETLTDKLRDQVNSLQELQRELKNKNTQLMEASRIMTASAIASSFAHQIKNPLYVIQTTLSNLQESNWSDELEVQEDLSTIQRHAQKIYELITYFNKHLQNDSEAEKSEYIEVSQLVLKTFELFEAQLKGRGVQVDLQSVIDNKGKFFVLGNYIELEQVFINLITNARDALKFEESPMIRVKLTQPNPKQIFIYFSDNGEGITTNNRKQIFRSIFTTKKKGTGVGLWFCDRIIQKMNGRIRFDESVSAKGTTFVMRLPIRKE